MRRLIDYKTTNSQFLSTSSFWDIQNTLNVLDSGILYLQGIIKKIEL